MESKTSNYIYIYVFSDSSTNVTNIEQYNLFILYIYKYCISCNTKSANNILNIYLFGNAILTVR